MHTLKAESLKYYKELRKDGVFCPAFKEKVTFSLLGWNHLVGNARKHRSISDIHRRLKLLPLVKEILSKAGTIQSVKLINGVTMYGFDSLETVEINGVGVLRKIRIIVIETKTGKKFLSIMDSKLK